MRPTAPDLRSTFRLLAATASGPALALPAVTLPLPLPLLPPALAPPVGLPLTAAAAASSSAAAGAAAAVPAAAAAAVPAADHAHSTSPIQLGEGKCVIILRGLPGSGKSSVAHQLVRSAAERAARTAAAAAAVPGAVPAVASAVPPSVVTSADLFFLNPATGAYAFDVRRLGEAHAHCLTAFLSALSLGVGCVIVDNTNIELWEYRNYKLAAKLLGYPVRVVEIACDSEQAARRMQQRNAHRVPPFAQANMLQRFQHDPEAIKIQPVFDDEEADASAARPGAATAATAATAAATSPARVKPPGATSPHLSAFVRPTSAVPPAAL